MELKSIISGIEGLKARGNLDLDIQAIESDSRKVSKNTMFIAISGFATDGHKYIKQAIENGKINQSRYDRYCKIYEELKEKEKRKW